MFNDIDFFLITILVDNNETHFKCRKCVDIYPKEYVIIKFSKVHFMRIFNFKDDQFVIIKIKNKTIWYPCGAFFDVIPFGRSVFT